MVWRMSRGCLKGPFIYDVRHFDESVDTADKQCSPGGDFRYLIQPWPTMAMDNIVLLCIRRQIRSID